MVSGLALIVLVLNVTHGVSLACNSQSCSTNYQVNELFFGTGAQNDACSSSYCANQTIGETGVGQSNSTNYRAQAGFNTDRSPSLTLIVNGPQCSYYNSVTNLGYLSTGSVTTGNANFSVESYLASGYVVKTVGSPPTSNGPSPHTLAALTSGGSSSPGTEQFGMNLVANTSPNIGKNPQQLPDTSFSFGQAASGYNAPNTFRYNNGEEIADATQSSGITCYALSYIFNISTTTPDGLYTFNQSIVATSTF